MSFPMSGGRRVLLLCLSCLALLWNGCAAAQEGTAQENPQESSAELIGVWAGERHFGPTVEGPLHLEKRGDAWRAEIAGYRLPVEVAGGELRFNLPGEQGAFHGRLEKDTGRVFGQWIQPGGMSTFGQRFSTPMELEPVASGRWRGTVRPLSDRMRVYLVLEAGDDGKVRAFVRNPENNFGRLVNLGEVRRTGETVEFFGNFVWQRDEAPRVLLEGRYRPEQEVLTIFLVNFGGSYDLRRLGDEAVSDFYARSGQKAPYRYQAPVPREDGWRTGTLEDAQLAVEPIEAFVQEIAGAPIDSVNAPYVQALLIARKGELVLEEYFHGTSADQPHDVRSASKSLTTTLAGAAVHAGLTSLEAPVYATMFEGALPEDLDPRAERMTLEDLITMSSGLACDDWDGDSPGGEERMQDQQDQPDWYQFILDLPMLHEPGAHPAYCSGGMSLAGGVVAKAAGLPVTELFDQLLGRPLQMGAYHTNLMPTGEAYGGGGLRITARDLLKFGQLLLDDGVWNGRRILDEGWAAEALTPRHTLGTRRPEGYGYGWWRLTYEHGGRSWDAFYAGGNGGNYVIGFPELELVVGILASNYGQSVQHQTKYEAVPRYVLEAVLRGAEEATTRADR